MLRPLKTPQLRARLTGYTATTAAGSVTTVQNGALEGTFTNASSDPRLDVTLNKKYRRSVIAVASAGSDIGADPVMYQVTAPDSNSFSIAGANTGGGGDPGRQHGLVLGWDGEDQVSYGGRHEMNFPVVSPTASPRLLVGQIDASAGSVVIGKRDCSVVKNGTGDFTISFTRAFAKAPVVVVTCKGSDCAARVSTTAAGSCQVETFGANDAQADHDFNFVVLGTDSTSDITRDGGSQILVPFRKPRMIGFRLGSLNGTVAIEEGTDQGSLVDNGAGDYTLTYSEAFSQEPIVVCISRFRSGANGLWPSLAASSATSVQFETRNESGALGNPESLDVIVFGSDSADAF